MQKKGRRPFATLLPVVSLAAVLLLTFQAPAHAAQQSEEDEQGVVEKLIELIDDLLQSLTGAGEDDNKAAETEEVELTVGQDADACVSPGGDELDVDPEDSEDVPWPNTPGEEVTVFFDTSGLSSDLEQFAENGAEAWSESPCVEAVVVDECGVDTNCSTMGEIAESPDGDTDGESTSVDVDGERQSNEIELFRDVLDEGGANATESTVVHEMGHALGLQHRLEEDTLMFADSGEDSATTPDEVELRNLLVLYGS